MRPVTIGPIRAPISLQAFDVLWTDLYGDTPKPLVLDCPSPGETHAERAAHEQRVWQELARFDYGWPKAVHLDVRHALGVMRAPTTEIAMRGKDIRALAAGQGTAGVLGVIRGDRWELHRMDSAFLADALMGLLPEHPPAALEWQHVRRDVLAAAAAQLRSAGSCSNEAIADVLRDTGADPAAQRAFARIATEPFLGRAEFSGATSGGGRSGQSVLVHDTTAGRYLIIRKSGHILVGGAKIDKIILELRQMVDQTVITR